MCKTLGSSIDFAYWVQNNDMTAPTLVSMPCEEKGMRKHTHTQMEKQRANNAEKVETTKDMGAIGYETKIETENTKNGGKERRMRM